MFGCSNKDELIGHSPLDFSPKKQPDDESSKRKAHNHITKALNGEPQRFMWRHLRRNGNPFDAEVSLNRLPFRGETRLLAIARDITERKRAEKSLAESEELYRKLVTTIPDIIIRTDLTGIILYVNEVTTRFGGDLGVEKILGKNILSFIAAEDMERAAVNTRLMFEKPLGPKEYALSFRKDVKIQFEVNGDMLRQANGTPYGMVFLCRDITDRKSAERALQESEERYRMLVENSLMGIGISLGNQVVFANPALLQLFGYDNIEELARVPLLNLVTPASHERIASRMEKVVRGEPNPAEFEYDILRKDGQTRTLLANSSHFTLDKKAYTQTTFQDITERKLAEVALRASEEKYRTLFEESRDTIFSFAVTGEWLDLNPSGRELFGYSSTETLRQKKAEDVFWGDSDLDSLRKTIERQGFVKDFESHLKGRNGQHLAVQITASVIRDNSGAVSGYRGIIRDVTEQKRLFEQFLQSQKMEAVGRLAGGIAHDFNNLLTAILGNTELGLLKSKGNVPLTEKLNIIKDTAVRAAQLTRQLLTFSRKEVVQPISCDLNESIENMKKILPRVLGEDIDCQYRLAPDLGMIHADPTQLELVILNLVVNAREAMPDGGELIISTENVILDEEYCSRHSGTSTGPHVKLTVSDTGLGMEADLLSKVFEPFYTTKPQGTGLGLSMVYGIITQAKGHVAIESRPGKGTTFAVWFVTAAAKPKTETESRNTGKEMIPRGHETLLVVEDESVILKLIQDILGDLGYRVIPAADADEALRELRNHRDDIDLLITDVVLPGKKGTELAKEAKGISPELKVIFISGYTDERIADTDILQGKVHFIAKPFATFTLARKVRDVLDG